MTNNSSNNNKTNTSRPSSGGNNAGRGGQQNRGGQNRGGQAGGRPQQRRRPGINGGQRRKNRPAPQPVAPKALPEKITFYESLTVGELAKELGREPSEIVKKLFLLGVMATINQELDKDTIELIATDYGVEVEEEIRIDRTDLETYFEDEEVVEDAEAVERPPVVTIMGHVDHG
ncbi:MAG: translation initiation factor IF-2 N-terminal domain-containing protein, partial [Kurthia sp.]|nr:translation initiation factor IF-2 N-terminal domain-containing protein [Kurthia sp.]